MKPCRWMIGLLVALGVQPSWAESSPEPASPPKVLSWVAPDYPQAAQEAALTPRVEVVVQVDENGGVLKASADSFPQGITEACEEAARQWRFAPGGASSRAVHLVFSFVLDRSGSRLRTPPERLGPYHIRVWGHFWGEPTMEDRPPCLEEGDFTLSRPEPQVLSWEAPSYTEVARKARLVGTVVVVARVDSKGRVAWECAQKYLPMGLSKAGEEAVVKWRFAPDPLPVRWVEIQFDFKIDDGEGVDLVSPYHLRIREDSPPIEVPVVY